VREFPRFKPEEMFALVSDIESYPIFVPGCLSARIVEKSERLWRVENVFGFGPMRTRFMSDAELDPPHRLDISSRDGPWRDFRMCWQFQPAGAGCRVSCASSLELRSPLLAALAKFSEDGIEESTIAAFEARARVLFGDRRR
jgi:coenzyme Q-binding protein COQ10